MRTTPLPRPVTWLQPLNFPHKLGICERLFGSALSPRGVCWVQTGAGITWKLDLRNPNHRWVVYGKYEGPAFLDWAKGFLRPDGVVVDSGANIGLMLLYLSQWVPRGQVLAFEPGREQADWLEECLSVHRSLPVELARVGLGDAPRSLFLSPTSYAHDHGGGSRVSATEGEPIEVVRLEDELERRGVREVDLWKLDVEGHEIPALQGAERMLAERRVKALYVELSGPNGLRVRDYLSALGYACHLFDGRGRLSPAAGLPEHTNGLFLPRRVGNSGRGLG